MGVKEYKLPNGKTAVFEYDNTGVGKITLEALDVLMDSMGVIINALDAAQVVTCGECVYADKYNHCTYSVWWNGNADFCSHGIRRKEKR